MTSCNTCIFYLYNMPPLIRPYAQLQLKKQNINVLMKSYNNSGQFRMNFLWDVENKKEVTTKGVWPKKFYFTKQVNRWVRGGLRVDYGCAEQKCEGQILYTKRNRKNEGGKNVSQNFWQQTLWHNVDRHLVDKVKSETHIATNMCRYLPASNWKISTNSVSLPATLQYTVNICGEPHELHRSFNGRQDEMIRWVVYKAAGRGRNCCQKVVMRTTLRNITLKNVHMYVCIYGTNKFVRWWFKKAPEVVMLTRNKI